MRRRESSRIHLLQTIPEAIRVAQVKPLTTNAATLPTVKLKARPIGTLFAVTASYHMKLGSDRQGERQHGGGRGSAPDQASNSASGLPYSIAGQGCNFDGRIRQKEHRRQDPKTVLIWRISVRLLCSPLVANPAPRLSWFIAGCGSLPSHAATIPSQRSILTLRCPNAR